MTRPTPMQAPALVIPCYRRTVSLRFSSRRRVWTQVARGSRFRTSCPRSSSPAPLWESTWPERAPGSLRSGTWWRLGSPAYPRMLPWQRRSQRAGRTWLETHRRMADAGMTLLPLPWTLLQGPRGSHPPRYRHHRCHHRPPPLLLGKDPNPLPHQPFMQMRQLPPPIGTSQGSYPQTRTRFRALRATCRS